MPTSGICKKCLTNYGTYASYNLAKINVTHQHCTEGGNCELLAKK